MPLQRRPTFGARTTGTSGRSPLRRLRQVVGAASLGALLLMAPLAGGVRAIPQAEALKKLSVIPVFVLADPQGTPLPIPRGNTLYLPLYLERVKAEQELAAFLKTNPTVKAGVLPLPLNVATERAAALNKTLKGKTLVTPVVSAVKDMDQARQILRQQGLDEKTIREGLEVPVFFTTPLITTRTPNGNRGLFFFDYASLQRALASIPDREKLKVQAADLSAVLDQIIKQKEDRFAFFPTPEYFRLVEQQSGAGAGGGNGQAPRTPPPPARP